MPLKNNTHNSEKTEKVRLNFEVTPSLRDELKELQERTKSASVTEVFRKSLALLDMVTTHVKDGGTLSLKYKDGREEFIRFL